MHEYTLHNDVRTTNDLDCGKELLSLRSGRALHLFINSHIIFSKRIFILNNITLEGSVERRRAREIHELLVFEDVYKIKRIQRHDEPKSIGGSEGAGGFPPQVGEIEQVHNVAPPQMRQDDVQPRSEMRQLIV